MGDHWLPFLPLSALRLLSRLPAALPVSRAEHAVVLFADLAGFTPLSEALAALGPAGGEAMRTLLNRYFDVLVAQISGAGGDVATFAGDAMTAVFPYPTDRAADRAAAIRSAVRCAGAMQRALAGVPAVDTPHGDLRAGMKIGLAAGPVVHAVVGDPAVQLLYVLAGRPLQDAAAAERRCREAEVVLDPAMTDAVPLVGAAAEAGFRLLAREPADRLPRRSAMTADLGMDPVATAALLPPVFTGRLGSAASALGGEHRTVTSVFVALPDLDVPGDGGARLQAYAATAVRSIARYGGDLRQIDAGDKGYQLVLGFGAPRSHADDAERAVACCLELMQLPGGPYRAGVATGAAFCGEVGANLRREFTVLGDSVNVAARLAHSARPGELLVDARTAARIGSVVRQGRAGPLTVKGKSGPVQVRSVRGLRDPPLPLLDGRSADSLSAGRADELAAALACLDRAATGSGQVLTVIGEPGIGKSHLVGRIVAAARAREWACYGGAGGSPADRRGYLLWRPIWRTVLGVPDTNARAESAAVRAAITAAGPADERMPLFGPVLGVPLPDTALTASLDGSARARLTGELVLDCLRRKAAAERIVIVLEDCHWIDESSRALLSFLAPRLADLSVLLLAVARDEPAARALLESLHALPHTTCLHLRELPPAAARLVVREQLRRLYGTRAIPDRLVERLVGRGAGNPFFLSELAGYVRDREPDPEQVATVPLPEDVRRLVVARLDALAPQERLVITAASVIGPTFRQSWIRGCLPAAGTDREVADRLNRLAQLDLVRLSRTAPEPEYDFTHAITHEVAYTTLDSDTRTTLHEAVAAHLERTYPQQPAQYADVLAHHYGRTRNADKQRTWFRIAADTAQAGYANDAAIDYYRRLLPLLPAAATAEVLVRLGTVLQLTGRWTQAEEAFQRALREASRNGDRPARAAARRSLGMLLTATRAYAAAARQLTSAAAEFTALGDDDGVMWTLDRLAFALYQQGDYPAALQVAQRQLAGHRALGDRAGMSAAADNIGMVHWLSGAYDKAAELLRWSYQLGEESGDVRITVHAANDLAGLLADRGDHQEAVAYLQRAVAAANRIGYRQLVMTLTRNAGEIYRERGAFQEATRCYTVALRGALDLGAWTTIGHCVAGLATAAVESGQPDSDGLLVRAIGLMEALQCRFLLAELWHLRAQRAEQQGHLVRADRFCACAQDVATRLDARSLLPRIRALRLRLGVTLGTCQRDAAIRELTGMLAEWTDPPEQALLHATISELDPAAMDARRLAAQLYRKLYEHAPSVGYAAAYRRLTGDSLAPPEPLPPLGIADAAVPDDVDNLLAQIERLSTGRPPPWTDVA